MSIKGACTAFGGNGAAVPRSGLTTCDYGEFGAAAVAGKAPFPPAPCAAFPCITSSLPGKPRPDYSMASARLRMPLSTANLVRSARDLRPSLVMRRAR